ncbi:MAG: DoxX family protein [Actinobacteria bacterium]|nr:MAG: DoxX family protein [Actinomycetota bacterium]
MIRCPVDQGTWANAEEKRMVAYIVVAGVFTVMLTMSARMKLVRDPVAVEVIGGVVGVPLNLFPVLALLEIAGAVGLLAGIALRPLGVAAAACLVVYFVAAVTSHLRKRDLLPAHLFPGVVMLVVATAALALRLS